MADTNICVGLIPDAHIPFHDPKRLRQVFDNVRGCEHIIIMGDWLDAYSVSSFDKDPRRKERMPEEFAEGRRWLRILRKENPDATIDFIEGNHEERFMRYLIRQAPALVGMKGMSIREQLELDDLNIRYHDSDGFTAYGIRFKHGQVVSGKSGYSAHKELEAHNCSGVSVHTHRMGFACRTTREGILQWWWEGGHVCDETKAEYVKNPNWQAGHLLLHPSPDGVEVTPIWL